MKESSPNPVPPDVYCWDTHQGALEGVRKAALEIANRRAQELRTIKQALENGDADTALRLMHQFFGIPQPKRHGQFNDERAV